MDANKGREVKEGYRYTDKHEWVKAEGNGTALCGISDFAQNSLGDIVYVELSAESGSDISGGDVIAVVESAKAASDVYSPVSGKVLEINSAIEDSPETVNKSPYDEGWFIKLELADTAELEKLMTPAQYTDFLAAGG
ncbi:MAG: glycine cleavage system protein GcvH [Spirochaetia bacterium]|jgi:glycine cleavage system H protein|nr:glycine cleavage system protein GcvH [Spirochaetia bacterium]